MFLWEPKRTTLALACLLCWLTTGTLALASSTPSSLPGSVDPGRMGDKSRLYTGPPLDSTTGIPAANAPSGDLIISGADQVVFTLLELKIDGMEAYQAGRFLGEYIFLYGKPVTLQQVVDVVNRINATYRKDGYIFSRAFLPEQDITSGVVTVQVVEAGIENVSLPGISAEKYLLLKPHLDKISGVRPFNIGKYEHWLLTLNQLPGAQFRSVLRQPQGEAARPGAIEVVILEESLPSRGQIDFNNFGSRYAGPLQTSLSYDRPRVFSAYDQIGLKLSATVPADEVKYGQIGYDYPVMAVPGLSFNSSLSWGGTRSGSNLTSLDVKGFVRELRLGMTYAALLGRRTNWLLAVNFDSKNARSKILGEELYDDRIRALRLSSTFQHVDDYNGATLLNAEISHGINRLGARESGSVNLSREDGRSDFTKLTFQISRLQSLPYDFNLYAQVLGQYAMTPLLSAEEFGYGGIGAGRGLDPSELTGDHGIGATLELRYNGLKRGQKLNIEPYVFIDFGKVWQKGTAPENAISSLSTGFGTRVDYMDAVSLNLLVAEPLTLPADNPPKYANGNSPRYLLSVSRKF